MECKNCKSTRIEEGVSIGKSAESGNIDQSQRKVF